MQDRSYFGHLLESFALQQLSIQTSWTKSAIRLWHYRDKDRVEVDCVLTRNHKTWGVEIKATTNIQAADGNGLRRLAQQAGSDFKGGIVLYDGTTILPIDKKLNLYAVPFSKLWEL